MSAVLKSVPKQRGRTVSVSTEVNVGYIDVDVDVDLADIDTQDLVEELSSRNRPETLDADVSIMKIYEAMACGRAGLALELMRSHIQDVTGRVLP